MLVLVSSAGMIHLLAAHELSDIQVIGFALILLSLITATFILVWGYRHRLAVLQTVAPPGSPLDRSTAAALRSR